MAQSIRTMRISLAAKCQILFGAAVVLILSAALFVPWWRMDQLMDQMNRRAAAAVADRTVLDHLLHPPPAPTSAPASTPTSMPAPPTVEEPKEDSPFPAPRLIGVGSAKNRAVTTHFDREAFEAFDDAPQMAYIGRAYNRRDGSIGYKYARPLYLSGDCLACHADDGRIVPHPTTAAVILPAGPTTRPKAARLIGLVSVDIPSQIETSQLLLNRMFILCAGLLAGMMAIIIFYWITSKVILAPVRVLQETAEQVSRGDLNIRCDISTGDEFQQLSETFNTMLSNLKEGEDQLRSINKTLDRKLEQLAETNVALYESNRLKSEFLANVSHELRTPLNSILGFAELARDGAGDPKVGRYMQNILGSGRNLLNLITDLLDLAKIEAGRMEVRSEKLSLSDLFEGLVSLLKPLSEAKHLTIVDEVAADIPILQTDPAKLQQILYNFMSNAIKFSPDSTTITLKATREDEQHVRISVSDHGPGIEADKQQLIFEKFRQLDASVTREHGGTGLGLAIAHELAQLLGGEVGVVSAQGAGATFWVMLPLKIGSEMKTVGANDAD
jgi:signal transduction histidine kinase